MDKTNDTFKRMLDKMSTLRDAKNSDYDDSFLQTYDDYGITGIAMDLGRKYERIKAATTRELKVKDESLENTLMDMALMAINALIWMELRTPKGEGRCNQPKFNF